MPKQGGLSPLTWESCSPESEACFCSPIFLFFPITRSTCTATRSSRTLHLARDVIQLLAYLVPRGRHHPAGIHSLLPDSNHTCSHDITLRIQKANLALRGVLHASTCALPVRNLRRALCEQNTLHRPRRVSHTRPPGEPIRSESVSQPSFCPSAG